MSIVQGNIDIDIDIDIDIETGRTQDNRHSVKMWSRKNTKIIKN